MANPLEDALYLRWLKEKVLENVCDNMCFTRFFKFKPVSHLLIHVDENDKIRIEWGCYLKKKLFSLTFGCK